MWTAGLTQILLSAEPVSKPVLRPSSMSISEGQSTTIGCSVKHGTPPIQFSLYHEKNKSLLMFFNSSNLEVSYNLTDVKQEDEGKYYCVGTNVANETKQSERVTIQGVFYPQHIGLMMGQGRYWCCCGFYERKN